MAQGTPKELAAKVRKRAIEALPEMLEDYILAAHTSAVPEDKRKAAAELAKLSGEFRDDDKGQSLINISWVIGSDQKVTASVTAAQVVDVEATTVQDAPEPAALPPPAPMKFDLNFDALLEKSDGKSTPVRR